MPMELVTVYDDFLLSNLYWIVGLSLIALIAIVILIDRLVRKRRAKKGKGPDRDLYLEALGGENNIISKSLEGSRIVLSLKDYTRVNRDKLRDAGVTGFIQMQDKLTLVIKGGAEEVYKRLFHE
jgi:phosphotransferase system IIB component